MGRRKRKGAETLMIYRDGLARKSEVLVVNRHRRHKISGERRTSAIASCTNTTKGKGFFWMIKGL